MNSKNIIAWGLIIVFVALLLGGGLSVVKNSRYVPDASSSSSSISSSSSSSILIVSSSSMNSTQSTFVSRLQNMSAHDISANPITTLSTSTVLEGSGTRQVKSGDKITVHYRGWLATNGTVFDQSFNHGTTGFSFTAGVGMVIKGWDDGVIGMKVGEVRTLKIPSASGYGATGSGSIPGNADLIFDVELISFTN